MVAAFRADADAFPKDKFLRSDPGLKALPHKAQGFSPVCVGSIGCGLKVPRANLHASAAGDLSGHYLSRLQ